MAINDTRLLELAIESLENKKSTIDEELAQLRSRLRTSSTRGTARRGRPPKSGKKRGRKPMSAATRRALSESMKQRWAERKKSSKR